MFTDSRVRQFWDPKRRAGIAYRTKVFPTGVEDALSSLPEEHMLRAGLLEAKDAPPKSFPFWDVAFFYERGIRWNDRPPQPTSWSNQVLFYGGASGATGMFWRDSFKKVPFDSDWSAELTSGLATVTGASGR